MARPLVCLIVAVLVVAVGCSDERSDAAAVVPAGVAPEAQQGEVAATTSTIAADRKDATQSTTSTTIDPIAALLDQDAAPPAQLRIPSIEVTAPVIPLDLRDDGAIEVPVDVDDSGWWRDGPEPGERGPAVILGHVDSYTGPGVFARLTELEPGDLIHVDRDDGTSVTYRVTDANQYDKESFPTEVVYGPTDHAVLRLVTCGGDFDRAARSYLANYIVFAEMVPGSDTRLDVG